VLYCAVAAWFTHAFGAWAVFDDRGVVRLIDTKVYVMYVCVCVSTGDGKGADPVAVMSALRELKNNFKG
jgi:hypothetical protein